MAFSDQQPPFPANSVGVDTAPAAATTTTPAPPTDARAMHAHLQHLLERKEKELQHVGTLGQRVLAQRAELEERVDREGQAIQLRTERNSRLANEHTTSINGLQRQIIAATRSCTQLTGYVAHQPCPYPF